MLLNVGGGKFAEIIPRWRPRVGPEGRNKIGKCRKFWMVIGFIMAATQSITPSITLLTKSRPAYQQQTQDKNI